MLVSANKLCADIEVMLRRFKRDNHAFAVDHVAGKYWAMKFEIQFAGDEIYVPANFAGTSDGSRPAHQARCDARLHHLTPD